MPALIDRLPLTEFVLDNVSVFDPIFFKLLALVKTPLKAMFPLEPPTDESVAKLIDPA